MGNGRRELLAALALCGAGAALVLIAGGRTWVDATAVLPRPLPNSVYSLTGGDLAPLAGALGLAGLAGLAGLVAVRGYARVAVGLLLALVGVVAAYTSAQGVHEGAIHQALASEDVFVRGGSVNSSRTLWWLVSTAGGALLAGAGVFTIIRGRAWPGMSRRYEAPTAGDRSAVVARGVRQASSPEGTADTEDMWESLSHGRDPTA